MNSLRLLPSNAIAQRGVDRRHSDSLRANGHRLGDLHSFRSISALPVRELAYESQRNAQPHPIK
jgi:hypothetical protein